MSRVQQQLNPRQARVSRVQQLLGAPALAQRRQLHRVRLYFEYLFIFLAEMRENFIVIDDIL